MAFSAQAAFHTNRPGSPRYCLTDRSARRRAGARATEAETPALYLVRVIVRARGPRLTENCLPVLTRTLAAVDTACRYSGVLLFSTPETRTLFPRLKASTLSRSLVLGLN